VPTLNSTGRKSPDSADISTFLASPTFTRIAGPVKLYRFGGRDGRWWYEKSLIDEMKNDFYELTLGGERQRNPSEVIRTNAREGLAVTREWNRFVWLCTMTLAAGDIVECWVGRTAPQLEFASKPDGRILQGGLTQYLIYDVAKLPRNIVTEQSISSLWMGFSKGVSRFKY
jgi:hypothetical protein